MKHLNEKDVLSVGELSVRSGVAVSALHFYETKGLIKSFRNRQNQRQYPRGILRIVSLIKVAQTLGFSLEAILEMFTNIPGDERPDEDDWKRLSKKWKAELDKKIQLMNKLRDQLDRCIGCGCLSLKDCPLRNPDDKLSRKGSGPHLL